MDSKSISGDPENHGDDGTQGASGVSLQGTSGVSRRSVMKAGAAAAWTVPLIQVVAAAPAVATSGMSTLALSGATGSWSGKSANLNVQVTIQNTGAVATTSLQVTMTFGSAWTSGKASATNWTATPAGDTATKTYTFTAATQLAAGGTTQLVAKFASSTGQGFATSISVSATAANSTNSGAASIPVAQA